MTDTSPRPFLRTKAVAERYGMSKSFFEKLRVSGGGPPYRKVGTAVLYCPAELDDWFTKHRPQHSTSEAA